MSASTDGIDLRSRSPGLRSAIELVSSMRFSIALLTVICIASVIGTVVKQHEPYSNYVNQFGPFWAEVFGAVGLYTVYGTWWFLLILAFLVLSTSLCIIRNTPKILVDWRTYKEQIRVQALAAFYHRGQATLVESGSQALERISALLLRSGWRARVQVRQDGVTALGTMIAARRGSANKLGYIAAHSAIVLVCVGGLLDGDLIVRAQMLLQGKTSFTGGGALASVPPAHRLGPDTPTFRANLFVPEGARSGTAVIALQDGVVLQDLPFDVELKKFIVDYYDTGMPKLFASQIVIHDHDSGESIPALVKVNEPALHRGVAIYQSSFDDGGSRVRLRALPMTAGGKPFEVEGVVGGATRLSGGASTATLEFTGLRVINVEDLSGSAADNPGRGAGPTDVRKVDLLGTLKQHLGSGAKTNSRKQLRNVGPSISYKLRDAAGQAREFNSYMLPVELEGQRVFLVGAREKADDALRYLRIPADERDSIDGWARLRRALLDPDIRQKAAVRYAALAAPVDKPELAQQLTATAVRVLGLFAGAEHLAAATVDGADPAAGSGRPTGGLPAIADFMEASVPQADRARISEVLLRILNGSLFEMLNLTRDDAGQPSLPPGEKAQAFMTQAVLSLSESFSFPAPVLLQLTDFTQVQASVFQVARAPGKKLVYLGAGLLIVGVFAMLYIRERRLWVWIAAAADAQDDLPGTKVTVAMSTTRRTLDADAEFEGLKRAILDPKNSG